LEIHKRDCMSVTLIIWAAVQGYIIVVKLPLGQPRRRPSEKLYTELFGSRWSPYREAPPLFRRVTFGDGSLLRSYVNPVLATRVPSDSTSHARPKHQPTNPPHQSIHSPTCSVCRLFHVFTPPQNPTSPLPLPCTTSYLVAPNNKTMAPRPYENKFRVRRPTPSSTPAVYAVPSGPQRGVHLLR